MSDTPDTIEWGEAPAEAAPTNAEQIASLTQVVASLTQVAQDLAASTHNLAEIARTTLEDRS